MKLMVTWQMRPGKLHETLKKFSNLTPEAEQSLAGKRIRLIGRWHDLVRGRGVAIYEVESAEDLAWYSLAWNDVMDLEVAVVLDDVETRALGQRLPRQE
jgi:hypothetical protein